MTWFEQLCSTPHVKTVLVTDTEGRILRSSRPMLSLDELIASMIQAAEVLAQTLSAESKRGSLQLIQIATTKAYVVIFPLLRSAFHLTVITDRNITLEDIVAHIEELLPEIDLAELRALQQTIPKPKPMLPDDSELNAQELIEAVREWLQGKSSDT